MAKSTPEAAQEPTLNSPLESATKEYLVKPGQSLSYGNKLYFEGDRVPLKLGDEVGLENVVEAIA